jgi:hypothetical protein
MKLMTFFSSAEIGQCLFKPKKNEKKTRTNMNKHEDGQESSMPSNKILAPKLRLFCLRIFFLRGEHENKNIYDFKEFFENIKN